MRLLAAVALAPMSAVAAPAGHDGRWSVEVVTERGGCDKAYRYPVVVEAGRVRYGGTEPVAVAGTVAANGSVTGTIQLGPSTAQVVGTLSGAAGQGTWTMAGSSSCSGRWMAERRG